MKPRSTYRAHSNIALAKYWGKSDTEKNLPSTPSASMTLEALSTLTTVTTDEHHTLKINGVDATTERFCRVAERLCELSGSSKKLAATSETNFPVASGLASSASGFAAFVAAACDVLSLPTDASFLCQEARRASASAARSIHGGFVSLLPSGNVSPIESTWRPTLLVALTTQEQKKVGSTEAMLRTQQTSLLYPMWVDRAKTFYREVVSGIENADIEKVGRAMEASTLLFHISSMNASPPILYWNEKTIAVMNLIFALRATGKQAYITMDAGPHVKVLCDPTEAEEVFEVLSESELVDKIIKSQLGGALENHF